MAEEKEYNRLLNLWDPPKDLASSSGWSNFTPTQKSSLESIVKELFSPNKGLPDNYNVTGDTKQTIKDFFGYDDVAGKPYSSFITDKINTLLIIRESHSSGQDPRPTGLYVSQDTGPNDVVTKPKFIITPGTLLDPASKTKDATATFDPITKYGSLPREYIESLYLDTIINGEITATKNEGNTKFTVTIPTKIGPITTDLNATFQPISLDGDGAYFKGNPRKNSFILVNKENLKDAEIRNHVKKYLLVKELGDTLQVQWLNYIFDTALEKGDLYTRGNTVIITNDTVVLYRSLVNKVPVILTYMGKTRFFKSTTNDPDTRAAIDAAMIQTIRDETIRHNLSVIKVITDVIAKGEGAGPWIGGNIWYKAAIKTAANTYLTNLVKLLENMNKDYDIYLSNLPNSGAAKDFAARSHFICPFVWCKGGYYKQVTTVTHLLPGYKLNFPAASFTALSLTTKKLTDGTFVNVGPLQGGGGKQRGGARKSIDTKKTAAAATTTPAMIQALITQSITDWLEPWTGATYTIDPRITSEVLRNPSSTDPINGNANNIEELDKWIKNVSAVTKESLKANGYFLYWYVREFYPQIFTYAYVFKKAIEKTSALIGDVGRELSNAQAASAAASTKAEREEAQEREREATRATEAKVFADRARAQYENVPHTENLLTKYLVEGRFNSDDGFLYLGNAATAVAAFNGTHEAISLAEYFVDIFPQLQTLHLANFFSQIRRRNINAPAASYGVKKFVEIIGAFVPIGEDFEQEGGGVDPINPLAENAMDIYEIYYSLNIQAAYNDRSVTDAELERTLARSNALQLIQRQKDKKSMQLTSQSQYDPFALQKIMRLSKYTGLSNEERESVSPAMTAASYGMGGKSRRRKTQKKRKSSKKQRKTRRHKK